MNSGGKNTTINGLLYEKLTDLSSNYTIIKQNKNHNIIKFNEYDKEFIITEKYNFIKYLNNKIDNKINKAHGCIHPDECIIDEKEKLIYIIEKKFQQSNGSICEKIQTSDFKLWQYSRLLKNYKIIYIYCLSEWYRENCKAEL